MADMVGRKAAYVQKKIQMNPANDKNYRERVFEIVRQIPPGRVMTYGQIAAILGEGYTPRTVGYTMHAAEGESVPWQRVINSQGKCSTARLTIPIDLQRSMLEQEGIEFDATGKCDLHKYQWSPEGFTFDDDPQPGLFG